MSQARHRSWHRNLRHERNLDNDQLSSGMHATDQSNTTINEYHSAEAIIRSLMTIGEDLTTVTEPRVRPESAPPAYNRDHSSPVPFGYEVLSAIADELDEQSNDGEFLGIGTYPAMPHSHSPTVSWWQEVSNPTTGVPVPEATPRRRPSYTPPVAPARSSRSRSAC